MKRVTTTLLGVGLATAAGGVQAWSLEEAAKPYEGTSITVVGLERPSYKAAQKLTPQFEERTGINVNWVSFPYESTLKAETLNFVSRSQQFDLIITDVVWPVTFASADWVVPVAHFLDDPELADPDIDLDDFFPVWRKAFTIDGKLMGLPFDSYAGLLYYNKQMLQEAGLDGPPETWAELRDEYAPKLMEANGDGVYPFALQSAKGETQTADSFARFLWPWGGRFIDIDNREVLVDSEASTEGIEFRQSLMEYMPEGIVADNHSQVVALFSQGKAAMITEWSAFYSTLKESGVAEHLGIAPEPSGPDGTYSAFGGFAYMVSAQVPEAKQNASWLFVQWLTSKEMGKALVENGAVVARRSVDTDPQIQAQFPHLEPMVETWENATVPDWRPQLRCYPKFSEIVSDWGTRIQLGDIELEEGLAKMDTELSEYMESAQCWETANQPRNVAQD